MNTKIFCDIADLKSIKKFNKKKIVKGFTTNPSLMRKAGAKDYKKYSKKILEICKKKPVSLEVFADNYTEIREQSLEINKLGKNVYVKIPVVNSRGLFMGKIIEELNQKKIKLNITAVYSSQQVSMILKKIKTNTKIIISIFVGRLSDSGKDPISMLEKSIKLAKNYKNVEILWASTREPYNYIQAKKLGFQIITAPPSIIEKIENFKNITDKKLSISTVKGFLKDSKLSKFNI